MQILMLARGYGLVVWRPLCKRKIEGSNPSSSTRGLCTTVLRFFLSFFTPYPLLGREEKDLPFETRRRQEVLFFCMVFKHFTYRHEDHNDESLKYLCHACGRRIELLAYSAFAFPLVQQHTASGPCGSPTALAVCTTQPTPGSRFRQMTRDELLGYALHIPLLLERG